MKHSDDFLDAVTYGMRHGTASFKSSLRTLSQIPKLQPSWSENDFEELLGRVKEAIGAASNKRCVRVLTRDCLQLRYGPVVYLNKDHRTYSTKTLLKWIEEATVREVSKRLLGNEHGNPR